MVFALEESATKNSQSFSLGTSHPSGEGRCTPIIILQELISDYHKGLNTFKVKI